MHLHNTQNFFPFCWPVLNDIPTFLWTATSTSSAPAAKLSEKLGWSGNILSKRPQSLEHPSRLISDSLHMLLNLAFSFRMTFSVSSVPALSLTMHKPQAKSDVSRWVCKRLFFAITNCLFMVFHEVFHDLQCIIRSKRAKQALGVVFRLSSQSFFPSWCRTLSLQCRHQWRCCVQPHLIGTGTSPLHPCCQLHTSGIIFIHLVSICPLVPPLEPTRSCRPLR